MTRSTPVEEGEVIDVTDTVPALEFTNLSKTFGSTRALDGVDLVLRRGEVHGFVGRNGSGKSTLIKVLSGYHVPDPGATLRIGGQPIDLPIESAEAARQGLSFVHQDLGLLPEMTVLENVRVGRYTTGAGWRIPWRAEHRLVADALERFGVKVSPNTLVNDLRAVDRALVAIVRGLIDLEGHNDGILVLDEPTAYLPRDSVEQLFSTVRAVAKEGTTVMFVSHRLPEVMDLTDRTTVIRDGRIVATLNTADSTDEELIEHILGGKLDDFYPEAHNPTAKVAMTMTGLSGAVATDVDLTVHSGEIVGLTGIAGAGYDEVPYLIFGAAPASAGQLSIGTKTFDASGMTPLVAMRAGMALLPGDRARTGGVGEFSLTHNVSLPVLDRFFSGGRLRHKKERSRVAELLAGYTVQPNLPEMLMGQLSGGNQQKALLAKWLQREPPVLLLHEPTQGVDVGAKADVFERLKDAADAGSAVLYCSAEYEDLAQMCDRVLVFQDGRVIAELSGAELTEDRLVEQCYREDRPTAH